MFDQPQFGRRLKRLRTARGLSQADVVGDGMSTGHLSRLESGDRRPTERTVAYLARRLGVDASALTGPPDGRSLSAVLAAVASAPPGTDSTAALGRAVEEDSGEDPAARWQALWLLSQAADRDGDYQLERTRLRELLALSRSLDAPDLHTRSLVRYARCTRAIGDMHTAESTAAEALSVARTAQLSVPDTLAALLELINTETELGRWEAASQHVDELERDLLPRASAVQAAEALWTAAVVSSRKGDDEAAVDRLTTALGLVRGGQQDLTFWARLRTAAAAAALQMSPPRVAAAKEWLTEAASVLDLTGTPAQLQELRALQAHLAFAQGRFEDAALLSRAVLSEEALRLPYRDRVRLSVLDGRLAIHAGRVEEGVTALQQLARQATQSRHVDLAAHVWQVLATTLAAGIHPSGTAPCPAPSEH
ncbi:transcriptional regulator with XRE-family HTH domain [Streptomyces sp. SAI-133]|uniref:helix-turn-helix domain-containing protein n=1 Tax=unclassified Streptomyces TaxID=2593676 RepID=UPI0024752672|nr:helix-turn-helix domain-containing protein [Streptomyces sp. SAI-133]MDH6589621.1 transcriptional regulator with XRE-family HTH domain [Streptomyces sp. SAI-133]